LSPKRKTNHYLIDEIGSRSSRRVWEAATKISSEGDLTLVRPLIRMLKQGKRPVNRAAAAYALSGFRGKDAVVVLEETLRNKAENSRVRGQAAEALAYLGSNRSISLLTLNLRDQSKEVRFWCAFALGVAGTLSRRKASVALPILEELARKDGRSIHGLWSVAEEAKWAMARIKGDEKTADEIERKLYKEVAVATRHRGSVR
jgi:HEAT repeat protein